MLVPKLVTSLRGYTREQAIADVIAGVIVGIVALPLTIAFAIASGLPPEYGLYTGIVAGFLISALGGSRVQIGGPTGAFVVIVYGIVQQYGVDGLTVATIMAGVILVVMGVARLGAAIKFIPFPVTLGFTSGIAVVIFSSQVRDLLGLRMESVPAEFLEKWVAYAEHAGTANPQAIALAAATLVVLVTWPKVSRRIPAPFVAILAATGATALFGLDVETIGSRFGEIQAALPRPRLPSIDLARAAALVGPAFTIALLGAVESLLSAVVADGMIGGRHRSNMELVAQGIANIAAPIFGGMPATGAIARTATNVKNGGRTPIAGMVHAIVLLLITLFLGRWVAYIPLAALAAVLVVVSYHMSEWRSFKAELTAPKSDVLVMLTTFTLTVVVDLTVAIQVGMVLAAFLFMRRMAEVTNVTAVARELHDAADPELDPTRRRVPPGVLVYEINGPFFFGAAGKFRETISGIANPPKVLIIRMRDVPAMDSTGLRALREVVRRTRADGTLLLLSEVHAQPMAALARSDLLEEIGEEALVGDLDEALERARTHLGLPSAHPAQDGAPSTSSAEASVSTPAPGAP
jgi:SulP family sulfate permease